MSPDNKNNNDLLRYAGLTTQIFVGLGLALFLGKKVDQWSNLSAPVFIWILPLLMLAGLIIKLVIETGRKRNDKQDLR